MILFQNQILTFVLLLLPCWLFGWLPERSENTKWTEMFLWLLAPLGGLLFLAGGNHRIAGATAVLALIPFEAALRLTEIEVETDKKHHKVSVLEGAGRQARTMARGALLLATVAMIAGTAAWAAV